MAMINNEINVRGEGAGEKPELLDNNGFIGKPFARKKIVRNPDGSTSVIFVDARTGKQVNPKGYTVIQSDNNVSEVTNVTNNVSKETPKQEESLAKKVIEEVKTDHTAGDGVSSPTNQNNSSNTMTNNYGYVNKPAAMGFAGMLPGPFGVLGKVANLGVNASNTEAVNDQREALGFTENSALKNIGSSMFDQQGYIGDMTQTKSDGTTSVTPVGFEAEDKVGRTTYTPEEARRHMIANPTATEATAEEKKAAIGTFNNTFPEEASFTSKLAQSAKSLFSGLFGGATKTTAGGGGSFSGNSGSFPDAPQGPTNSAENDPDSRDSTGGTGTNGGYSSPGLF